MHVEVARLSVPCEITRVSASTHSVWAGRPQTPHGAPCRRKCHRVNCSNTGHLPFNLGQEPFEDAGHWCPRFRQLLVCFGQRPPGRLRAAVREPAGVRPTWRLPGRRAVGPGNAACPRRGRRLPSSAAASTWEIALCRVWRAHPVEKAGNRSSRSHLRFGAPGLGARVIAVRCPMTAARSTQPRRRIRDQPHHWRRVPARHFHGRVGHQIGSRTPESQASPPAGIRRSRQRDLGVYG